LPGDPGVRVWRRRIAYPSCPPARQYYALEISAHRLQTVNGGVPPGLEKRVEDGLLEIRRLLQAVRDKLPELGRR
jgi:hypothetical protein